MTNGAAETMCATCDHKEGEHQPYADRQGDPPFWGCILCAQVGAMPHRHAFVAADEGETSEVEA